MTVGNQEVVSHETQAALDIRQQLFDVHHRGIGGGRDSTVAAAGRTAHQPYGAGAGAGAGCEPKPTTALAHDTHIRTPGSVLLCLPTTPCPSTNNGLSAQSSKACPD